MLFLIKQVENLINDLAEDEGVIGDVGGEDSVGLSREIENQDLSVGCMDELLDHHPVVLEHAFEHILQEDNDLHSRLG